MTNVEIKEIGNYRIRKEADFVNITPCQRNDRLSILDYLKIAVFLIVVVIFLVWFGGRMWDLMISSSVPPFVKLLCIAIPIIYLGLSVIFYKYNRYDAGSEWQFGDEGVWVKRNGSCIKMSWQEVTAYGVMSEVTGGVYLSGLGYGDIYDCIMVAGGEWDEKKFRKNQKRLGRIVTEKQIYLPLVWSKDSLEFRENCDKGELMEIYNEYVAPLCRKYAVNATEF